MSDRDRQSILLQLIRGDGSPAQLAEKLKDFGWDSEVEIVTLTPADAIGVLRRFVAGELSSKELEQWADAIEGRDDIAFEPRSRSLLTDLVFELANPSITQPPTSDSAAAWIERLRN